MYKKLLLHDVNTFRDLLDNTIFTTNMLLCTLKYAKTITRPTLASLSSRQWDITDKLVSAIWLANEVTQITKLGKGSSDVWLFISILWIQLTISIPRFLFMTKNKIWKREHKNTQRVVDMYNSFLLVGLLQENVFQNSTKMNTSNVFLNLNCTSVK